MEALTQLIPQIGLDPFGWGNPLFICNFGSDDIQYTIYLRLFRKSVREPVGFVVVVVFVAVELYLSQTPNKSRTCLLMASILFGIFCPIFNTDFSIALFHHSTPQDDIQLAIT